MLPEDWKLTTLGKVCEGHLQTGPFGSQLHAHEYQEIGVTVVMPKDIINCRVDASKAAKITIQRAEDLKKHQLLAGDLLFSRRGDVTRFALIDEKSEGSLCGTGCLKARPSKNHSPIFLSYILQRNMVKTWLEHNAVGQTMPNMNTAILAELPLISASSREEEDKIAQILSTWDKAMDKFEALIIAKQKRKKALMQQLLTGKKRFSKFGQEWKQIRLKKIINEERSRNKNRVITRVLSVTNHSGFVLPKDQFSRRVASDDLSNYKIVRKSEFGYNPSRINVGSFARLDDYDHGVLSPMYIIFSINDKLLDSDFFINWMKSHEAKQKITSSTQGSVRDSVGFDALGSFLITLPPIEEQQKIAIILSTADKEITIHQNQLVALKQQKKSLMQQLLTGKKRVF